SDVNYYFITVDNGPGKRISGVSSVGNPNVIVSTFDDFRFHENDEYNFLQSGREWYGDIFNFSITNRDFNFDFPNIDASSPILVKSAFAARSTNATSTFNLSANGQVFHTETIGTVGAEYTQPYATESIKFTSFNSNSGNITLRVQFSNPSS